MGKYALNDGPNAGRNNFPRGQSLGFSDHVRVRATTLIKQGFGIGTGCVDAQKQTQASSPQPDLRALKKRHSQRGGRATNKEIQDGTAIYSAAGLSGSCNGIMISAAEWWLALAFVS